MWLHDVLFFEASVGSEVRLYDVSSTIVDCDVGLSRLDMVENLYPTGVYSLIFKDRDLFAADIVLTHTCSQCHPSWSENPSSCHRDVPALSAWNPFDLLNNDFFPWFRQVFDEEVDVPVQGACYQEFRRQNWSVGSGILGTLSLRF